MIRRNGLVASMGAALLAAGCASWGLSPVPKEVEAGKGLRWGLDITPDQVSRAPSAGLGFDAFPETVASGPNPGLGLSPFPYAGRPLPPEEAPPASAAPASAPAKPAPAPTPAEAPPSMEPVEAAPKAPQPPPPAPRLALKFSKGETVRYRSVVDTLIESPMFGDAGMKMQIGMDLSRRTLEVASDGAGTVENTFDSLSMLMDNPMLGGEFKFDTRDEESVKAAQENPMLGQMVGAFVQLVGKSATVTLGADGGVRETGSVEMLEQMGGAMGGPDMGSQLTGLVAAFSPEPVREGLSWKFSKATENALGTLTLDGSMTVVEWDPVMKRAVISQEGTMTRTPPENVDENDMQAQMAAMMELKEGTMKGELVFDAGAGLVVSSRNTTRMVMDNPMMGGEMNVQATMTLERIK